MAGDFSTVLLVLATLSSIERRVASLEAQKVASDSLTRKTLVGPLAEQSLRALIPIA